MTSRPPRKLLLAFLTLAIVAAHVAHASVGALPATFVGAAPCGSCAGIHYQINLLSGGAYMQRTTYLRDGHDDSYYRMGRWSMASEGHTLTLDGDGRDPTRWTIESNQKLRRLDPQDRPASTKWPSVMMRAAYDPIELRARLTGMYRYMADAARFRDCRTGLSWPVASDMSLEGTYMAQRAEPGAELMVTINARIEQRPKMEGDGTEPTLVVERFISSSPGKSCGGEPMANQALPNNRWRPTRIRDETVVLSGQQHEPWIVLDPKARHVTGSGGCNRISGSYKAGSTTLTFGPITSTQMACGSGTETETAFLRALDDTREYRVHGRTLELLDGSGRVIVVLEERNLN